MPDEFEDALKAGKTSRLVRRCALHYAEWMNATARPRNSTDGEWQQEPDYVKALELFRRLMQEFAKGETRYYDQAQQQIKNITEPSLGVGVSKFFCLSQNCSLRLNARNLNRIDFALYKIDMTRDVRFTRNSGRG